MPGLSWPSASSGGIHNVAWHRRSDADLDRPMAGHDERERRHGQIAKHANPPSPPFPARWCWSAPARWAAPCSKAGWPASCRRRRSWSRPAAVEGDQGAGASAACASIPKGDIGTAAAMVIAVKPQTAPEALPPLAPLVGPKTVVVSIMAGRTLGFLEKHLPKSPRSCAPCRTRRPRSAAASRSRVGNRARERRRDASSRTRCSPRPARSNGSTTRR